MVLLGETENELGKHELKNPNVYLREFDEEKDVNVHYSLSDSYKTCIFIHNKVVNYFECEICSDEGYARVGFAGEFADLYSPLGYDTLGYSLGSKNGYGFHKSKQYNFGLPYKKFDILSCLIYEADDQNYILFYVNGNSTNMSFKFNKTSYFFYPSFSLYDHCEISFNFGPYFAYKDAIDAKLNK